MNIYVQIKQCMGQLSANEKKVAEYILEHPDRVLSMTADRLAGTLFVSKSAVYRFCDKVQLAGFADLKRHLAANLDSYLHEQDFDFDFPVQRDQTPYEMLAGLKEVYRQTVEVTTDYMRLDQLRLAASAMRRAEQIDIYASAGNVFFAENFAFQMQEIGVSIQVPVDEYRQRLVASASDMTHMAILITFEGRGMVAKKVAAILRRNKVPTLLICSPNLTGIEGNYTLYMSPHENHAHKVSSFSTRLSLLFIFDALYAHYFSMDYEGNFKKRMEYYHGMGEKGETS